VLLPSTNRGVEGGIHPNVWQYWRRLRAGTVGLVGLSSHRWLLSAHQGQGWDPDTWNIGGFCSVCKLQEEIRKFMLSW